jgi:hypothetical protein
VLEDAKKLAFAVRYSTDHRTSHRLPFPAADFKRINGAGSWLQRFERVLSHATWDACCSPRTYGAFEIYHVDFARPGLA